MIKLQKYTPKIYYDRSRDFQLLGRLFDLVLNSNKAAADMIYTIPDGEYAGSAMIDLLASTLGFKRKHEYSVSQLIAVCSILPLILRKKGSKEALELVCSAILRGDGNTAKWDISCQDDGVVNTTVWRILIPKLKSINLLLDLLDYILPAGVSCIIAEGTDIRQQTTATEFTMTQCVNTTDTNINFSKIFKPDEPGATHIAKQVYGTFVPLAQDEENTLFEYDKDETANDFTNAIILKTFTKDPA